MKASELRIGNLFIEENSKKIIEVIGLEKNRVIFSGIFLDEWQAKPILLTEEWLIKLGFERKIYNHLTLYYFSLKVLSHGEICFHPKDYGFNLDLGTTTGYQFGSTSIKYVHQLQNLYFALTNEELL